MTLHATSSCHPFLAPLRTAPTHHGEETHVFVVYMCLLCVTFLRHGETNVMETFGVLAVCTSDGRVDQVHILKQVLQKKRSFVHRKRKRFTGCGVIGKYV